MLKLLRDQTPYCIPYCIRQSIFVYGCISTALALAIICAPETNAFWSDDDYYVRVIITNDDNDLDDDDLSWSVNEDFMSFFAISIAVAVLVVLCGCCMGSNSDNDCCYTYVVVPLWIIFQMFDIMSDWGFYYFDCPDTLKTPSLVFCIFGTILTAIAILFNMTMPCMTKLFVGMGLFLFEDLPQFVIVVHAIMTPSLYADDHYSNDDEPQETFEDKALGTIGIISLVFSSIGLLVGIVKTAMWCCYAQDWDS